VLTAAQAASKTVGAGMVASTLAGYLAVYAALLAAYIATVFYLARHAGAPATMRRRNPRARAATPPPVRASRRPLKGDPMFTAFDGSWLPVAFAALMGAAILLYVVLDGYDLGVGILTGARVEPVHKDRMIASIGPFWDANETWLVLPWACLLVASRKPTAPFSVPSTCPSS
jgi:hypothetical protein